MYVCVFIFLQIDGETNKISDADRDASKSEMLLKYENVRWL